MPFTDIVTQINLSTYHDPNPHPNPNPNRYTTPHPSPDPNLIRIVH